MTSAVDGVAIVGMAGRFPDAASIEELWALLVAGYDGISHFDANQLSASIPAELRQHPGYVAARGVIADAERFDAAFFGIPPREALLMDPQQRLLLELSWNALEHAGVDPSSHAGSIGVYAGVSNNGYRKLLDARPDLIQSSGEFAAMLGNEKDYVATRIAHRLGLNGPAISIHTACSTSLVAISQAWYALMSWQCDLALAGGINLVVPQESGYLPVDGGMESADGVCRPYDAAANGTVFSSGGGMVALKRLADAQAEGDTIFAVIRGVGVNNDGADKASFTAPSVRGQAAAIRLALGTAGIGAETIGYVEGHGTGTALGDPIEVEALTRAYREDTDASQYCWLGSLKGNFGHLVAGSGVAGLIKAALALHHGKIPPTLHYRKANPEIDFAASPFKVAARAVDWPRGEVPRRAGVSSFGVGGTNAHVVLEEAPHAPAGSPGRPYHVLTLSARDEAGLQSRIAELSSVLEEFDDGDLADVGYTLAVGRRAFELRCHVTADTVSDARAALARLQHAGARERCTRRPPLVFVFSGQGSQHANMARGLMDSEPAFRAAFDEVCQLAAPLLGLSLVAMIHPAAGEEEEADALLAQTRYTQPALFAVEYALAQWWRSIGVVPDRMIGHSVGEYVAACLAGVFSLADAVRLVVARAAAMQAQPEGVMRAVRASADVLRQKLPVDIAIAAFNAPELTVIAGSDAAMQACVVELDAAAIASTPLRVSHAFHSPLMDAAIARFHKAFEGVALHAPTIPFYSCVSGQLIDSAEATSADYWCRQLRAPVQFLDAVRAAAADHAVFVEVGPGQALTSLLRRTDALRSRAVASLGPAAPRSDDAFQLTSAVGELASRGVMPDWTHYYRGQQRRKRALPTYPFHGERYWIDAPAVPTSPVASGIVMPVPSLPAASTPAAALPRRLRIAAELTELFENLSGEIIGVDQQSTRFLEIGLDSLALTQAALEIERRHGIKIKFRRLMDDLSSIDALSALIDQQLPDDVAPPALDATLAPLPISAAGHAIASPALAQLIQNQLALLQQQSALLTSLGASQAPATVRAPLLPAPAHASEAADLRAQPFGASARIVTERKADFSAAQQQWIARFTARYNDQTSRSKSFSQLHRRRMADPRVVTGFNPLWKELVYPIVVERSHGARLWDIDGNEYIDLLNSFGANFLGYQPDYIVRALKDQLDRGMEIGPQHPLTAEVASLIGEMTGMARVAFCNTGSEAVMGAMRIARTVTGRDTIVIFTNSYHGIFDEVIVRGSKRLRSIAAAPGILANAVENVLVLDYGSDDALAIVRERAATLAAVMIEPVQGKNPSLQPRAFVKALREICDGAGCALIFDEVITGFRVAPGGAQEFYGVRADIATYGKVIGGGLPFAAIAGSSRWMDALDGGDWQFGDDSYPEAGVTYFAGTFVRHPLALAAARAALLHIKQQGPQLQQSINARTAELVEQLNRSFSAQSAPLRAVGFSSLWRIFVDDDQPFASLFWYALRERGLHVYEQFNCFLTEAHSHGEVRDIVERVNLTVMALLTAGMLTRRGSESAAPVLAAPVASEPATNAFPLSDAQLDKWLACQYGDEASTAYNESMLLQLDGDLDVDALARSITLIGSRHEAFQLRFLADGSGQQLDAQARLRLSRVDVSGDDADERLTVHCQTQMSRPFDLGQAPLARVQLIRLAPQRHALLFIGHHLIFDGWSAAVVLDELARGYAANIAGVQPGFAAAESYRAYVNAERTRRDRGDAEADIGYWKGVFAQLPEPLQLRSDRPRSSQPDFAAATHVHDLPATLTEGLRAYARRQGVTLYSVLLHGYALLLAEWSGQRDLVIGIPFAGQALAGSGSLVGDGVDMLPLRLHLDTANGVGSVIDTHRVLLDAADHQDLSLTTLIRAGVLPKTDATLTRVIFNLNPRVPALHFPGLHHALRDCPKTALFWDLFVNLNEVASGLSIDLHYASALFDAHTIAGWTSRYEAMLATLIEPAQPLTTAAETVAIADTTAIQTPLMVDDHEADEDAIGIDAPAPALTTMDLPSTGVIDAILAAARAPEPVVIEPVTKEPFAPTQVNAPSVTPALQGRVIDIDRSSSVPGLIAAQANATPLRIAVEAGERRLTYAGLIQRVDALATALIEHGVGRGELVGVCLPRGLELPIALLGVQRAAAAYVPLDPGYPDERLRDVAEQAQLKTIVALDAAAVPASIANGRRIIAINDLDLRRSVSIELPQVGGHDLAYVLFTSGSTGRPKGVRVLQRNLVNFFTSMAIEPGIEADDALVAVTTLSFDIAGLELHLPLLHGARIVIASDDEITDPVALATLIRDCDIRILQTTPTLLRMLLDGAGDDAVRGLKLLVGGEALPRDLADRALVHADQLWNMYGPTETTIWSTVQRVRAGDTSIALGLPIANTSIHLLDENGIAVADGMTGEIVIGGDGVADGYLDRADLTAERFIADPQRGGDARLYRTGDVGSLRDGRLHYHGRSDHQVKIRGHRIELGDIESTALQLPLLRDAVATAHEFSPGDQRLLLYVTLRNADADPSTRLRDHLRSRLPGYMLPQQVIVLDELPRTPNGKIDRKALPAPQPMVAEPVVAAVSDVANAATDPRELYLGRMWRELIGLRAVHHDDNFFEIGGHSLLAVEMATRVQKDTGVRLNLLMIATGTLGSLAAKLPAIGDGAAKPSALGKVLGLFGLGKNP